MSSQLKSFSFIVTSIVMGVTCNKAQNIFLEVKKTSHLREGILVVIVGIVGTFPIHRGILNSGRRATLVIQGGQNSVVVGRPLPAARAVAAGATFTLTWTQITIEHLDSTLGTIT
jgi:hypothetical protein